jgi:hypothetical protein
MINDYGLSFIVCYLWFIIYCLYVKKMIVPETYTCEYANYISVTRTCACI